MLKRIEAAWNARTPVWLNNGTKENFIFQLAATVVIIGAMSAYMTWKDKKDQREFEKKVALQKEI